MSEPTTQPDEIEAAHADWFREPTRRERVIGAGIFVTFGVFFALLFVVLQGWWFRWVILSLGAVSVLHGLRHARLAFAGAVPGTPMDR